MSVVIWVAVNPWKIGERKVTCGYGQGIAEISVRPPALSCENA